MSNLVRQIPRWSFSRSLQGVREMWGFSYTNVQPPHKLTDASIGLTSKAGARLLPPRASIASSLNGNAWAVRTIDFPRSFVAQFSDDVFNGGIRFMLQALAWVCSLLEESQRLLRVATVVVICLTMTTGFFAFDYARVNTALAQPTTAASTTLADAPSGLRSAVASTLDNQPHQFTATYSAQGARFSAPGVQVSLATPSIGRAGHLSTFSSSLTRATEGATYGTGRLFTSFAPILAGIEQSFNVEVRPSGIGPLTINVPVHGLIAATSGSAVDLSTAHGVIRANYSALKVIDARGHVVAASMRAAKNGQAIVITIRDAKAIYPLTVDPTLSLNTEIHGPTGVFSEFGIAVAISGTTALVSFGGYDPSNGGSVGVFTLASGSWSQTATLYPTYGTTNSSYGYSVAISGNVAVVGQTYTASGTGEAYVYTRSGGTWSQTTILRGSLGSGNDAFGESVAIAGSDTIVVGAPDQTVSGLTDAGLAYVFALSGGTWSQTAVLNDPSPVANSFFGMAVSMSGDTQAFVGSPGQARPGRVYVYDLSGGSWSLASTITPSDSSLGDYFGGAISANGSSVAIGALDTYHAGSSGAAYVFTQSGGTWTQSAEEFPPGSPQNPSYGTSVALFGSALLVGSPQQNVGTNTWQGEAYLYSNDSGVWSSATSVATSDGTVNDVFGWSVALSNDNAIIGAPQWVVGESSYPGGKSYFYSLSGVTPEGTIPTTDSYAGGSPSELCQCADVPATKSVGDPVDTATGDLYQLSTDISLPGAGVPLDFTRTYDAQNAQTQAAVSSTAPPLGYGWSDNFGMNVSYNSTTQVATVTDENGAQVTFSPYLSGTSPAWCTGLTNFCAMAPRVQATLNQNGDGSWTYGRNTGSPTTFNFFSTGTLSSIADQQGDTLTPSSYSPTGDQTACPTSNTCVAWTSSASGRELVLATNGSGQLTEVFDANSSLAATYAFSGTGCSTWGSGQTPELCNVVDPGGLSESFTYDSLNSTPSFDYDMLTDTPPGGSAQTANVYNVMGQIVQQTNPAGDVTTFSYSGANSSLAGGTTTITNYPLGTSAGEPQDVTVDSYSSNVLVGVTTGYGTAGALSEAIIRDPASLMPLAVEDGNGNSTSNTYQTYNGSGGSETSSGNVLTSSDALGNMTAYAYNAFNQAWCSVDAADYANGDRCPSSAPTTPPAPGTSDPNLGATINFYNSSDQLTAMTDALGHTTVYAFTSGVTGVPNGLEYCSVDPVSYQKGVTCPAYGATHVSGTMTSTFDAAGDVLTVTNANGATTTYVYGDTAHPGLVSSMTDPNGTLTTYTYNGAGQVISQVVTFQSYSATTLSAYDTLGRQYCSVAPSEVALGVTCPSSEPTTPPTAGSDPYLGTTITTYNANGQVVQITNPLGGITLTSYDGAGNVLQTTVESNNASADPNVVTTYAYDADNRVIATTVDPGTSLASTMAQSYDPNGNVYCTVSANAYAAGSSTYQCPTWQASWIASVPSPSTLYSTTPSSSQANNVTTDFYNANGNLVQSINPDVQTSISAFDADGRTYCTADPVNVALWLTANPSGTYPYLCPSAAPTTPPVTGSNPGYVTNIYDTAGDTLSSTNQLGDTTSYTYDAAGHVLTTSDPRGEVTTNCYYDENGTGACAHSAPATGGTGDSLYSTTTPVTSADPSGETTTFTYYAGGASETTTTPAATITKTYDANGDELATLYSGVATGYATPTNTSATYNVNGTQHTMTDPSGTTTYGYDAMGDVTSQDLLAAGGSGFNNATTSYSYFATGDLATLTYPAYSGSSDPVVTYAYDATGAMLSSTDWLGNEVTYSHDANGNQTGQNNAVSSGNPSGTSSTTFTYDAANNNTSALSTIAQTCGSGETIAHSFSGTTGSRNADGQLTQSLIGYSATCSGQTSLQRNYSYDVAGHVVFQGSVAQGSSANNLAYDASGDPTTISSHSGSAFDTYTQSFDAAGEVTGQTPISGSGGSSSAFTYNTLGNQIQNTSTTTTSYGYNAIGQMTSVTAPSGTTTYLYNASGLEAGTTGPSGAPLWNPATDVNSTRAIDAVTCTSTTFCVAVGASGYVTLYNGTSWSTPIDADSTRTLDAVSCTSSIFCVAVDTSGYATTYNGTSWSTPTRVDSTRTIDAVTCTSTTFCVAVGASGYATTYNGTSWSTPTRVDSTRTLDAVTCTSSIFCVAVDTSGYATKFTGTWATATDIDSTRTIDTVTCVSTTLCEAAGASGYAITYNGTSWSSAIHADSSRTIKSVRCPSATLCVAIDGSGYALTYNGSSWSTPVDIDGSTTLESLSCVSTTFCDATDTSGNVFTFEGSTWSTAKNIDGTRTSSSISCVSTTFCVAVDNSGYASVYSSEASVPSQLDWNTNGNLPLILGDSNFYYVYGPGSTPVEEVSLSTSAPTYMTYSPSDSTWLTTNQSGDATALYGYDAYGTVAFGTPSTAFGFAGQYADSSTGFSNLRARFYDSQTGSFVARDPAFSVTDIAYSYALGDPVNQGDATGLYPNYCSWIGFVCGSTADVWQNETQFEIAWLKYVKANSRQYVVTPPQGQSSPIAYRRYDLYRTDSRYVSSAWELKVGRQTANLGNWNQIVFDEAMLLRNSIGYTHGGDPANIRLVTWWEQPKWGAPSGLTARLANRLQGAVDATGGRFSVEVDFPESDSGGGSGTPSSGGGSGNGGLPLPLPRPEPVPVPEPIPAEVGLTSSNLVGGCGSLI